MNMARMTMVVLLACVPASHAAEKELFANGDLSSWEVQTFEKVLRHTQFELVEEQDGPEQGIVLEAVAQDSASGYIMNEKMPFGPNAVFSIAYKVLDVSNPADEQTKAGDDFALRVYLTSKSLLFYRTLVLVHSDQHAAGASWHKPL